MATKFKRCPLCGSATFLIRNDEGVMYLFTVSHPDGTAVPTNNEHSKDIPTIADETAFDCTACAWRGTKSELKEAIA